MQDLYINKSLVVHIQLRKSLARSCRRLYGSLAFADHTDRGIYTYIYTPKYLDRAGGHL